MRVSQLLATAVVGFASSSLALSHPPVVNKVQILPAELKVLGEPSVALPVAFPAKQGLFFYPGQELNSNQTVDEPHPVLLNFNPEVQYVFLMVDPSINTTDPIYVGLHTIVANLTAGIEGLWDEPSTLAPYISPEPRGTAAHDYTLLLFEQPRNFAVPAVFAPFLPIDADSPYNRVNFPLVQFVKQTGLKGPVAATWFKEGAAN